MILFVLVFQCAIKNNSKQNQCGKYFNRKTELSNLVETMNFSCRKEHTLICYLRKLV